ncbi:MAG: M28 family peptidase [Bacteroidota bacterium]|nr:M28 family peptidase [Bacteroidota bacterium]
MSNENFQTRASNYLNKLCCEISERCVGSEGNRIATTFFEKEISSFGWQTELQPFNAIDWEDGGATLKAGDTCFSVYPGPYSLGCDLSSELSAASTVQELEKLDAKGKIVLLYGDITKEQLMPKNFVFYNPDEHKKIVSLLENSGAKAFIAATGRNSALAGGVYPFPLIEDGDFDIPSVYMKDIEGQKLLPFVGKVVALKSLSRRIPGNGFNVVARKGEDPSSKVVITAHIDAKKGTPGAIDNATGVTILLLVAEMLKAYKGERQVEIVALNGEDYFAVPGQMKYIAENHGTFEHILLDINIDGAGYFEGDTAYSFYGLPHEISTKAETVLNNFPGICKGIQWPQGDHSIFVQYGRPAIALTSKWFTDNMECQDVTHTEKDNLNIVDVRKVVTAAEAISKLVTEI